MSDILTWTASATTMVAALMTAANLGTRITGWGFVVFAAGSIAWSIVAISTGQTSLLITNGFLLLVNLFGVWRWLGRQARLENGSEAAISRSRQHPHVPSLFSSSSLVGSAIEDRNGERVGTVIDAMHDCASRTLSYIVLSQGGVAGAGETLRAIGSDRLTFIRKSVRCDLSADQICAISPIDDADWPAAAPSVHASPHQPILA